MPALEEELFVVVTAREAQEVAGYLVFEMAQVLPLKHPPRLRIDEWWIDIDELIQSWLELHPESEGEHLGDGVGLRRIMVLLEFESGVDVERIADEELPQIVERVIGFADEQGIDLNYHAGAKASYFGMVRIVNPG